MRGADETSGSLFSNVDIEARIPASHRLRRIRRVVNDALASLGAEFERLYRGLDCVVARFTFIADEDAQDRQLAYIGESEGVGARLSYHNSNEAGRDAKGFWTDTVVLISKDENLTKSHARYVEACLIRGVVSNPRWTLPNTRTPSDDAGKLPLPDRAAMDEFVDQTKTLVGALGWDLFREVRGRAPEQITEQELPKAELHESPRFFFRGDGFAAEMEIGPSGDFVVTAGSRARVRTTRTIPRGTVALRNTLVEKGVLREEGDFLVFTSAYSFTSASAAAAAVIGASANGRILWKLPDGRNYGDWEANQDAAGDASGQF